MKKHSPRFLRLVDDAKTRVGEISVKQVLARRAAGEDIVIVDVREKNEWAAGHVKGAIHLGKGILERDIEKVIPSAKTDVVLYCGGGYRSALAADSLLRMGYLSIFSLAGGWRAWLASRAPVV
mgnify:CR=1 FL=1